MKETQQNLARVVKPDRWSSNQPNAVSVLSPVTEIRVLLVPSDLDTEESYLQETSRTFANNTIFR